MGNIISISTIGQDSHRFGEPCGSTAIRLGGIDIPFDRPIEANSDGDVVYHAITNAISGYTGVNILGGEADKLVKTEYRRARAAYPRLLRDKRAAERAHKLGAVVSYDLASRDYLERAQYGVVLERAALHDYLFAHLLRSRSSK